MEKKVLIFFAVCVILFSLSESKNLKNVVKRSVDVDEDDWRLPGSSLSDDDQKKEYLQFLYNSINNDQDYQDYLETAKILGINPTIQKRSVDNEEIRKPKTKI